MLILCLDVALMAVALWLGWKTISDGDPFRATLHFIGLGLIVAVAWIRLRAPDVALAEAAVGAGLTGALVITTVSKFSGGTREAAARQASRIEPFGAVRQGVALASSAASAIVLAVLIGGALLAMPDVPDGLTLAALAELARSGVSNPVTAALLNYRGYDTLLEIAVLLVAVIAVWSVREVVPGPALERDTRALPVTLSRIVVPSLIVGAAYVLWRGAFAPGGAFQAGALIGGAGVLLVACGLAEPYLRNVAVARLGLILGASVFGAAAWALMSGSANFLEYRPSSAKHWILAIETAATISIGLTLAALYLGGRPSSAADPRHASEEGR